MQCNAFRHRRRINRPPNCTCEPIAAVAADHDGCCTPHECLAEELYHGIDPDISVRPCYDKTDCVYEYSAGERCGYWPSFAHPRWLSCGALYNKR